MGTLVPPAANVTTLSGPASIVTKLAVVAMTTKLTVGQGPAGPAVPTGNAGELLYNTGTGGAAGTPALRVVNNALQINAAGAVGAGVASLTLLGPASDNNWGGAFELVSQNGSVKAGIRASTGGLLMSGSGGTTHWRIEPTVGHLWPGTDRVQNIGTNAQRVLAIFASNLLDMASTSGNPTITMRPSGGLVYSIIDMGGGNGQNGMFLQSGPSAGYIGADNLIFRSQAGVARFTITSTGAEFASGVPLRFGGATTAFPLIKNSGSALFVRLANDSNFANVEAAQVRANADAAGNAIFSAYRAGVAEWSFGMRASGVFSFAGGGNLAGADVLTLGGSGNGLSANTIRTATFTVATLPSASTYGAGTIAYVTDAAADTYNAVLVGGGAIKIGARSDGTNWRAF